MEQKSNRGGYRVGSGRKPNEIPKITWSVKVTETEKIELIQYLKNLRTKRG